ncbi:MAG: metal-dependent hydrolase [Luminiphilus sp.]|nr:metal-dependent hydrolase [Luminiphilus sp.]
MDPLSQAAIGAAASQSFGSAKQVRHALWIGALAGMAPDLDVLIRSDQDPLLFLEFHRQFTHSLFFIPIGALICAIAFYPLAKKELSFKNVWLLAALGYGTHGLLDACTTYGTQLLWPFMNARFAWHNVSVIDPLFTLPLMALIVAATIRQKPFLAACAMIWAVTYLGVGLLQHQRALSAAQHIVGARGQAPIRLEVKPGFANLLVWKAIYEFEERYYVDAVRVGLDTTFYLGQSVAKLNLEERFPYLAEDSQQARDIERFRWFSDDWLAVDANNPTLIVDMRYSQLPNAIRGLWGILVQADQAPEHHVAWVNQRDTGKEELAQFWSQVRGRGAERLPQDETSGDR